MIDDLSDVSVRTPRLNAADARPERVGTAHGLYDADGGNCLPIPEA